VLSTLILVISASCEYYPPPEVDQYIIGEKFCYLNGDEFPLSHCVNHISVTPEDFEELQTWSDEVQEKLFRCEQDL